MARKLTDMLVTTMFKSANNDLMRQRAQITNNKYLIKEIELADKDLANMQDEINALVDKMVVGMINARNEGYREGC